VPHFCDTHNIVKPLTGGCHVNRTFIDKLAAAGFQFDRVRNVWAKAIASLERSSEGVRAALSASE
jgi:hypothetical protein